jgi:hypothetical protein
MLGPPFGVPMKQASTRLDRQWSWRVCELECSSHDSPSVHSQTLLHSVRDVIYSKPALQRYGVTAIIPINIIGLVKIEFSYSNYR